ncbi:MAG: endonuclease/exonuclease/phosphatase family protein [Tepidisphaeraceae bacterium]
MLGCGSSGSTSPTKAPPRELTALTYNIHRGVGTDGKLDLPRIAGVISAEQPDFVALQEVDNGTRRSLGALQAAELAKLTSMHIVFGPAMTFDGGQYGDAVLSRWPIVSSRVEALPWTRGEQHEPRCAVAITAKLPGGAGTIEFISTHFDHTREPSDRLIQAQAVNERWRDAKHPTILAGDFNCEVGSAPMEALAKDWTLVSGDDPAAPTCCGATPKVKIDHVFVKPSERWRVVKARVLDERTASDHRPVRVTLELMQDRE